MGGGGDVLKIVLNKVHQISLTCTSVAGAAYIMSYIHVLPDEFLLRSVVFKFISKEISRAEHEYMNIPPPPPLPINALATALLTWFRGII